MQHFVLDVKKHSNASTTVEYCHRSSSTVKYSTQQRTHHVLTNTSLHLHVRIDLHGTGLCNATGGSVQRSNNFQISPAADSSICIELAGWKSYSNTAKPLECLLTAFIAPALRGRCLHHPPQRPPPRPLALRLKLSRDYKWAVQSARAVYIDTTFDRVDKGGPFHE